MLTSHVKEVEFLICKRGDLTRMKTNSIFKLALGALVGFSLYSLPVHAADAATVDDLSQANLESDFQAEDQKNLGADLDLAKQDAKQNQQALKQAQRKSGQLRIQNEKTTHAIQSETAKVEAAKQNLQEEQGKIEKLQIDLVNNRKEVDRLHSEYADLSLKRTQARAEEAKLKKDMARVDREQRQAAAKNASVKNSVAHHHKAKAKKVIAHKNGKKNSKKS